MVEEKDGGARRGLLGADKTALWTVQGVGREAAQELT